MKNKSLYIGITIFSVLFIIILGVFFYVMYRDNTYLFKSYTESDNIYVVQNGTNGLQFIPIPSNTDIFVSSSSSISTQKSNMISSAMSSLEVNGTTEGVVNMENITTNNSSSIYIFLIFMLLLIIGVFISYVAISEDN